VPRLRGKRNASTSGRALTAKGRSREFGAAGERIVSWCNAIELLVDRLAKREGDEGPILCDPIDGLAFAIATMAHHDIVSVTLVPDDREVPLGGRYQGPRIVAAS
jgi:hypothetical protein